MKFFKKNQIIIYVIALMLVTAGYLSYTTNMQDLTANAGVETAEAKNIGDAQLVSSEVLANNTNDINSIEECKLYTSQKLQDPKTKIYENWKI